MMTISIKKLVIILLILYGIIFFAQRMINRSVSGIHTQQGSVVIPQTDKVVNTTSKTQKARKASKDTLTPQERYEQSRKNFDRAAFEKKYGIKITPRRHGPASAEEWQEFVENNIAKADILNSPEAQNALSPLAITGEEFEKQMGAVQKGIDQMKEKIDEDPFNGQYQQKLQNMYRLQALGNSLKEKVVIKESAAGSPETPSATDL